MTSLRGKGGCVVTGFFVTLEAKVKCLVQVSGGSARRRHGLLHHSERPKADATLRGKGTTEAAETIKETPAGRVIQVAENVDLRLVQTDTHLGIVIARTRSFGMAHRVFSNADLTRETRLRLAESLLFTSLFHGAKAWSPMQQRLDAARVWVLRKNCGQASRARGAWTDQCVRLECGAPAIEVALFAGTGEDDHLRALLQGDGTTPEWTLQLWSDIHHFREVLTNQLREMPSWEQDPQA